jgi:hypothetical protein
MSEDQKSAHNKAAIEAGIQEFSQAIREALLKPPGFFTGTLTVVSQHGVIGVVKTGVEKSQVFTPKK